MERHKKSNDKRCWAAHFEYRSRLNSTRAFAARKTRNKKIRENRERENKRRQSIEHAAAAPDGGEMPAAAAASFLSSSSTAPPAVVILRRCCWVSWVSTPPYSLTALIAANRGSTDGSTQPLLSSVGW